MDNIMLRLDDGFTIQCIAIEDEVKSDAAILRDIRRCSEATKEGLTLATRASLLTCLSTPGSSLRIRYTAALPAVVILRNPR